MRGRRFPGHITMRGPRFPGHIAMRGPRFPGHIAMREPRFPDHIEMREPRFPGHIVMRGPWFPDHMAMRGLPFQGHIVIRGSRRLQGLRPRSRHRQLRTSGENQTLHRPQGILTRSSFNYSPILISLTIPTNCPEIRLDYPVSPFSGETPYSPGNYNGRKRAFAGLTWPLCHVMDSPGESLF